MNLGDLTIFIAIFPIVYGSVLIKNGNLTVKYDITFVDHCQGSTYKIANYKDIPMADCVTECAMRIHCKALNYHAGMLLCELFKDVEEDYTNTSCTHIQRKHIEVVQSPCGEPCNVGSSCDLKTRSCETKECSEFPNIINGYVLGNRKQVGRKRLVKCFRGYKPEDDIKQTVCTDEGLWNPMIECISVGCNQLSTPDNVTVVFNNGTQTHAIAKYECKTGYVGTQTTWTRRCEEKGLWSGTEPKCTLETEVCGGGWNWFNFQCYYFDDSIETFQEAETFCQSIGGHLVSIHTVAEKDYIRGQVTDLAGTQFWIGLTDEEVEGIWRWIDTDEQANYFDWYSTQPNQGMLANCGGIWGTRNYQWVDEPCSMQYLPICKKPMMNFA